MLAKEFLSGNMAENRGLNKVPLIKMIVTHYVASPSVQNECRDKVWAIDRDLNIPNLENMNVNSQV